MNSDIKLTSNEERAIKLLASGIQAKDVALTIGVNPSYISQLLSKPEFVQRLAETRFNAVEKYNDHDDKLDKLEDSIIEQITRSSSLVHDPLKLARLLQVVNAAKRRGANSPDQNANRAPVVQLTLPIQIIQKFTVNGQNQVVTAGDQDLVTIQSANMNKLAKPKPPVNIEFTPNHIQQEIENETITRNVQSTPSSSPTPVRFNSTETDRFGFPIPISPD